MYIESTGIQSCGIPSFSSKATENYSCGSIIPALTLHRRTKQWCLSLWRLYHKTCRHRSKLVFPPQVMSRVCKLRQPAAPGEGLNQSANLNHCQGGAAWSSSHLWHTSGSPHLRPPPQSSTLGPKARLLPSRGVGACPSLATASQMVLSRTLSQPQEA